MEISIRQACEHLDKSHQEDAPEWAQVEALRAIAVGIIALAEDSRNVILELRAIRAYLEGGDLHPADEVEQAGRCPMCDCK